MNRFRLTLLAVIALATVAVSTQTASAQFGNSTNFSFQDMQIRPNDNIFDYKVYFSDPQVRRYKLEIRKTSNGPWEYAQNTTYNAALERIVSLGTKTFNTWAAAENYGEGLIDDGLAVDYRVRGYWTQPSWQYQLTFDRYRDAEMFADWAEDFLDVLTRIDMVVDW
jgi:hypothetical protein